MPVKKSDSIGSNPDYFNRRQQSGPGDIATIYDIGPLYTAGIDGTGMKIAIMGQTDIYAADIAQFRAGFGLIRKRSAADTCHRLHRPGYYRRSGRGGYRLGMVWRRRTQRNHHLSSNATPHEQRRDHFSPVCHRQRRGPRYQYELWRLRIRERSNQRPCVPEACTKSQHRGHHISCIVGDSGAAACDPREAQRRPKA